MIKTYESNAIKVQSLNLKKQKKKIKCQLKNLESIFCEDSKSESSQQRNKNLHNKEQVTTKVPAWNHQQNLKFAAFLEVHIEDLKNKTRFLFREWANYAVGGNYRKLRDRLSVIYGKWSPQDIESYALSIRQRLHLNNEEMQLEKFKLMQQKNTLKRISSPRQLMRNGLSQFLEGQQSYQIPDHKVKFSFGPISQMFQPANLSFQLILCSNNQPQKHSKKYSIMISMDIEFIGCSGKQLSDVEKDWIQNELSIEPSESDFIKWQVQNMELQQKIYKRIQRGNEKSQKKDSDERIWTRNQKAKFLTFLWAYWECFNFEEKIKRPMFRRISYFVGTKNEQACENRYRLLAQSKRTLDQIIRDEQKQYGVDSVSIFEEGKKLREAARQETIYITEQIRDIKHLRNHEVSSIDQLDDETTPALVAMILKGITTVISVK